MKSIKQPQRLNWSAFRQEVRKRWLLLLIVGLYLGLGLLFTLLIYQFGWDQPATRWAARVFPLPAARVNGETIWLSHYYRRLNLVEHYGTASLASQSAATVPQDPAEQRAKTLDVLIEGLIFSQQAKKYDVAVTEAEITATYQKLAEANGGEENFAKVLKEFFGLTPFQFSQEYIPEELYREKLEQQLFVQIHPRWMIIQDEAKARPVLDRAKAGEDFAELAKQFSQDSNTIEKGGDLGWIRRGQFDKAFEEAAFLLKAGEVGPDLISTPVGFVIVKIEERQDAPIGDLSSSDWLAKVKNEAKVTRFVGRPKPASPAESAPPANP